jgi:hypothetical protein
MSIAASSDQVLVIPLNQAVSFSQKLFLRSKLSPERVGLQGERRPHVAAAPVLIHVEHHDASVMPRADIHDDVIAQPWRTMVTANGWMVHIAGNTQPTPASARQTANSLQGVEQALPVELIHAAASLNQ